MKILVILLLLGAIVASVTAYIKFASEDNVDATTDTGLQVNETTLVDDNGEFSGVGTLATLLSRNTNLECSLTYQPNDFEGAVTGSYFVSDGKVRGDFIVPAPELGGTVITSMIMLADVTYIWSEINGQLFGTKTTHVAQDGIETSINTPVPTDADVKYICKPWAGLDNSVFEPPTDVIFQDTAKLMEAGMEYGTIYE
jgi:hypothetical protein